MNRYGKLVLVFIASFSLVFVTGILRAYADFQTSSLLGSIAYFGITWFFLKKFSNTFSEWNILLVILLGLSVLQIPIRIMDWNANLVSLPDFIIHNIAILIAFLFYKSRRIGVAVSVIYFAFLVFMYLNGYIETDIRDNKTYPTVHICTLYWMAANLNRGTQITSAQVQFDNCMDEKYCFGNDAAKCPKYGGLYSLAMAPRSSVFSR
jgi:hypothetical protein